MKLKKQFGKVWFKGVLLTPQTDEAVLKSLLDRYPEASKYIYNGKKANKTN